MKTALFSSNQHSLRPAFNVALPKAPSLKNQRVVVTRFSRRCVRARFTAHIAVPHSDPSSPQDEKKEPLVRTPDDFLPEWDELTSDDTHIVVDGKEIASLIEELRRTGADEFGTTVHPDVDSPHATSTSDSTSFPGVDAALLNLAERRSDERDGFSANLNVKSLETKLNDISSRKEKNEQFNEEPKAEGRESPVERPSLHTKEAEENEMLQKKDDKNQSLGSMEYFADEHVELMPSWAREMYSNDTHGELEHGANTLVPETSQRRLHEIVAQEESGPDGAGQSGVSFSEREDVRAPQNADETVDAEELGDLRHAGRGTGAGGLVDCRVRDVAEDYGVPEEFVVDAMLAFGVEKPVSAGQSVRDSMTGDEIVRLLRLITSFDSVDLAERYSDRTITEVAEDYDLEVDDLLKVCEREGLYVHAGAKSRLSVVREDRVLDILLKGAAFGQPYPSPLDGLE